MLAASEQDFGVPKQNLRAELRFGPIFYPSLSFRTGPARRSTNGSRGRPVDGVARLCIRNRQKDGFVCDSLL
ncbi:hypothetical protein BSLA_01r0165 [Burkholderia stabilis]|nr:hypothetical protein BSLA_01r0165 [Burkholderia stabilis]